VFVIRYFLASSACHDSNFRIRYADEVLRLPYANYRHDHGSKLIVTSSKVHILQKTYCIHFIE